MTLDDATVSALSYAADWPAQLFAAVVREADRLRYNRPSLAQRKRYDAAYRAKRAKAGKGKHSGHLRGAAWHAARRAA